MRNEKSWKAVAYVQLRVVTITTISSVSIRSARMPKYRWLIVSNGTGWACDFIAIFRSLESRLDDDVGKGCERLY
jgi:hypothetical protein